MKSKDFEKLTKNEDFPKGISHDDFVHTLVRSHQRSNGKYHERMPYREREEKRSE